MTSDLELPRKYLLIDEIVLRERRKLADFRDRSVGQTHLDDQDVTADRLPFSHRCDCSMRAMAAGRAAGPRLGLATRGR